MNKLLLLFFTALVFFTGCKNDCPEVEETFNYHSIKLSGEIDSNLVGEIIVAPLDDLGTGICVGNMLFTGKYSADAPIHFRVIEGIPDSLLVWNVTNGNEFKFTVEYYGIGDECKFNYGGVIPEPYFVGVELVKVLEIKRIP